MIAELFQWLRERTDSMVALVVPRMPAIWASVTSGWFLRNQAMASGRSRAALLGGLQHLGVAALLGDHAVGGILLGLLQLLAAELAVADRVGAADVAGDLAVGDAGDLKRVQAAEIGHLLERQRAVVDQPDGGGLGHQDVGHGAWALSRAARPGRAALALKRRRPASCRAA